MENYNRLTELFTAQLESYITTLGTKHPQELYAPEAYILALGGKRVRPLLTLIACDLFEAEPTQALNAALAVELFHNFSLIHDDILDAAPLRRGKATVHSKWNSNIAILSGDVMLVKSAQVLGNYAPSEFQQLSTVFLRTAIEVCEGQQLDMNFELRNDVSVDEYVHMISLKTAVLLGCSLQMGAIVANASAEQQTHLYNFGKHLGIAFQLLDDLLDAFATQESGFGKQIGGDILANKKTFLTLKAAELANTAQKQTLQEIIAMPASETKVKKMLALYADLNVAELCKQAANEHTEKAVAELNAIPCKPAKKEALTAFALHLLGRQN